MIRHDHVCPEEPAISNCPGSQERLMNSWISKQSLSMQRANGQKYNRCSIERDEDAFGWVTSLRPIDELMACGNAERNDALEGEFVATTLR